MGDPNNTNTGMGGVGSGGDSATRTGAPPGVGGAGGQLIEPVVKDKSRARKQPAARHVHGTGETGDITGVPRVGAAGAREDSEAGGTSSENAKDKVPDTHDTASRAVESMVGSVLGDREPEAKPPPRSPG